MLFVVREMNEEHLTSEMTLFTLEVFIRFTSSWTTEPNYK